MFKKIMTMALALSLFTLTMSGCGKKQAEENAEENEAVVGNSTEEAVYDEVINFVIEMENGGVMKGELYPEAAPETVENFVKLCNDNFYEGLIFHRVIPGFMIQGGGYDADMTAKEAKSIKGEFSSNGFDNPIKHERGVISMARTSDPDSASSQFFIMHDTAQYLDGEYAAFGKITEGLEILDEIAETETATYEGLFENCPVEPQVIKTIRIEK